MNKDTGPRVYSAGVTAYTRSLRERRVPGVARFLAITYGYSQTWFGECLVGFTSRGICWLDPAPGDKSLELMQRVWNPQQMLRDDGQADSLVKTAFAGRPYTLDLCGTDFQLRVWLALLQFPAGSSVSYGQLARFLDIPQSARAVGAAVAANNIGILVPCHRVLPANAWPGNYRWGSSLKAAMLEWERRPTAAASA